MTVTYQNKKYNIPDSWLSAFITQTLKWNKKVNEEEAREQAIKTWAEMRINS